MTNNFFTLCSLFYIILLNIVYFSKPRIKTHETKIYQYMVICNLLTIILAITSFFTITNIDKLYLLNELVSRLLLITFFWWGTLFTVYIFSITFTKKAKEIVNNKLLVSILFLIAMIFCLVICVTPLYFHNNDKIIYSYGPAANITFISSGIDIIVYIICLIYAIKNGFNKKYIPFAIYLIVGSVVVYVQKRYPELLLTSAMETYITFLMYFTIENPDIKMIEKLKIARDEADKANRAKSDFLSSMSHEIRTPLNAIAGLSEDILTFKSKVPKQVKEDSEDIIEASDTLLEIVGNILDISKIESNKLDIVEDEYNIAKEIRSLAKINKTRIGKKPIELIVDIAEDIPYEVIGDKVHIKEIVNNLLSNAIKYTEEGSVTLRLKCINNDKKSNIIISVEDTGIGIKKESISRLFDKFDRLDIERKSTIEGTGLGLAITKRLVEMMGGTINVSSTYGKGSIFVVNLVQKISKMSKPTSKEKQTSSVKVDYKDKTVLVVDDNELNLKVANRALSDLNINIEESLTGKDCIEKVKKKKYDIILLDIMMPEMDGEETLKELKKIKDFDTPVVALTADALEGAKEKYLEEGFDGYIAKPFTRDQIKEKLDKIFNEK